MYDKQQRLDVVGVGESMGLVAATGTGPFAVGSPAKISFGGAETNVLIGLSRLGHRAAWIGRLGNDPIGAMISGALRGEGVNIDRVETETEVPTGLMLREHRTADRVRVGYYRRGMAGSRLAAEDIDADLISSARILHVTGITPALSGTAKAAVHKAIAIAREANVMVSFDLNYRAALWSKEDAGREFTTLAQNADIIFAGLDEAELIVEKSLEPGPKSLEKAMHKLAEVAGHGEFVLKLGADGAFAYVDGEFAVAEALKVTSIDPVGAGDAFVAGYLSGILDGASPAERLARANTCGAFAVSVAGDWEGLPRRHELEALAGTENVAR